MTSLSQFTAFALFIAFVVPGAVKGAAHKVVGRKQATKNHPPVEHRLRSGLGGRSMKEHAPHHVRERKVQACSLYNPEVVIATFVDDFPSEISWYLYDSSSTILSVDVGELDGYAFNTASFESACLEPDTCYNFDIYDAFGDGLTVGTGYFSRESGTKKRRELSGQSSSRTKQGRKNTRNLGKRKKVKGKKKKAKGYEGETKLHYYPYYSYYSYYTYYGYYYYDDDYYISDYNTGFYSVTLDGSVITAGKDYGFGESYSFCLDGEGTLIDETCNSLVTEKVVLTVETDWYVDEVGYSVTYEYNFFPVSDVVSVSAGSLETPFFPYQHSGCLNRPTYASECIDFTITDTYGDGVGESYNNNYMIGGYDISIEGETYASGTDYGYGDYQYFCSIPMDPSPSYCAEESVTEFTWMYGNVGTKTCAWAAGLLVQYPKFCNSYVDMGTKLSEICPGVCQGVC